MGRGISYNPFQNIFLLIVRYLELSLQINICQEFVLGESLDLMCYSVILELAVELWNTDPTVILSPDLMTVKNDLKLCGHFFIETMTLIEK